LNVFAGFGLARFILDGNRVDTVQYVDTFELTRCGLVVSGSTPIDRFVRLISDLPEQAASTVDWSVRGEKNSLGQSFLCLRVKAAPLLECQRCLAPFAWQVDTENRLLLVNSEAALDEDDAHDMDPDDDAPDRVVGSRRCDVLALVEDEIILSLPYVPKHEACPSAKVAGPVARDAQAGEERPSPFAVLGQLKKH